VEISWTDRVRNEEELLTVKEQRTIRHEISKRRVNWIGHILRTNCLLKHVIEGEPDRMIDVTGRRGRNSEQLLDDLKKKRAYCKLTQEALDRTV